MRSALQRVSPVIVLFTLVVLLFVWQAPRISRVAGWIPFVVLGNTIALLGLQWGLELAGRGRPVRTPVREDAGVRTVRAVAWIVALLPAIGLGGVIVGAGIFCVVFLRWHARESWRLSLGLSLGLSLFLYLAFQVLFDTPLYAGLLQWP